MCAAQLVAHGHLEFHQTKCQLALQKVERYGSKCGHGRNKTALYFTVSPVDQLPESILPTGCRSSGHCLRLAMQFKGPNTSLKSAIIWKSRKDTFKPKNQILSNNWLPNLAEQFLLIHRCAWVMLALAWNLQWGIWRLCCPVWIQKLPGVFHAGESQEQDPWLSGEL